MNTTRKDQIVRTTILVGGGLFLFAMTYGSGMRAQVKTIQKKDEERKIAQQSYRDAQRKLHVRLASLLQLEARRQVALALSEIDRQNLGTAEERCRNAAQLLQQADKANTNNPDLNAVIPILEQVSPRTSVNIGVEREKLQNVATQIDAALDTYVPDFLRASAEDDKAHPIVAPTMNDVPLPPGNHIKD